MKRPVLVLLSAMTLSSAALANPLPVPTGYFVGGFGEVNLPDSKKDDLERYDFIDEDGKALGLEFGYFYGPRWAGRIEWSNLKFGNGIGGSDVDGDRYGVDALYRFSDHGPFYGIMGLKHLAAGKGHTAASMGIGANTMISDHMSVFAEGTLYGGLDKSFIDFGTKLGLRYHFAASAPAAEITPVAALAPQPEPMDSDNDGVIDDEDLCPDSDPKYAVDNNGCVVLKSVGVSIELEIPFANDSAVVEEQYFAEIKRVADFMKNYAEGSVEISGHTSARGKADYNLDLSSRRAKAVADILVNKFGIAADRVNHKGYGETRLKDTSGTAEAEKMNRRIEAGFFATEQRKQLR
ncbi:OmpA family protein [Oceanospirillum beijerinckii]|uniref:OmpA family protein n=1 Tax=Oceanospirillum beijerinckii TaxID=64976 RepID=UPI0003F8EC95|nr:OmpA family protein [Oceanospirillum beijerinckii]MAC48565.1 OmpA family protein [Oceanospirillum sp.]